MKNYRFNREPLTILETGVTGSDAEVEATPIFRQAPLHQAALLGGPLLQRALETVPLAGDRDNVFIDTKVSYLMPGWIPSIPGWHTDGVPRGPERNPAGKGEPNLDAQEELTEQGVTPRYHTMTIGSADCPTRFAVDPIELLLPGSTRELYAETTRLMGVKQSGDDPVEVIEPGNGEWVSWDWWQLHAAISSRSVGWRLLIRVTETDLVEPRVEKFIRSQSQVYVPSVEIGW